MARLSCGDPHGAISLLLPLLQQHDFRDGWVALAAARRAAGSHDEAATAIGEALSRNAPDEAVHALLGQVAQAAGWPGWCGLSGDGTLHLDRPPAPGSGRTGRDALSVRLDGAAVRLRTRKNRIVLDGAWSQGRRLEVCRGGRPLLGSPIDVRAVGRIEGLRGGAGRPPAWLGMASRRAGAHPVAGPGPGLRAFRGRVDAAFRRHRVAGRAAGPTPAAAVPGHHRGPARRNRGGARRQRPGPDGQPARSRAGAARGCGGGTAAGAVQPAQPGRRRPGRRRGTRVAALPAGIRLDGRPVAAGRPAPPGQRGGAGIPPPAPHPGLPRQRARQRPGRYRGGGGRGRVARACPGGGAVGDGRGGPHPADPARAQRRVPGQRQ